MIPARIEALLVRARALEVIKAIWRQELAAIGSGAMRSRQEEGREDSMHQTRKSTELVGALRVKRRVWIVLVLTFTILRIRSESCSDRYVT